MSYDPAGNVTSIDDGVNGESISYSYDDLDRLLSAGDPVSETYAYNQIGNLLSKNGQALTYGDPAHAHAVTGFGSWSYGYDADGCMVSRSAQTIRYDPERRPVRVDENGVTIWRATYDGDGSRRKRLDVHGTIHYVGAYERSVGNGQDVTEVVTKYYTASMGGMSQLVAMRKNGVLAWVGTDHLGGTICVADTTFNAVDQMRYTPYGVDRDPGTHLDTDHKFTSQIEDDSIGLYWYASRAYDPVLGRFTAPDTIVPGAGNPQALNRYSYVLNNPLGYADASGHEYVRGVGEVRKIDGVYVVGNAEGEYKLKTALISGSADVTVTYGRSLIVSPVDIFDKPNLLRHEFGHVKEARTYSSDEEYRNDYVAQYLAKVMEFGGDTGETYVYHPMEINANRIQGLDWFWHAHPWEGQDPQDSVPDGVISARSTISPGEVPTLPEDLGPVGPSAFAPSCPNGGVVVIAVEARPLNPAEIPANVQLLIPAEYAPCGVGVVGITATNPGGSPANGGNWVSPGGANAQEDAAARRAAWVAGGSHDYNQDRREGKPGY